MCGVFSEKKVLVPMKEVPAKPAESDPVDATKNKILYGEKHLVKELQPHPSNNLVVEVQVPRPDNNKEKPYVSIGWTLLNLFEQSYDLK